MAFNSKYTGSQIEALLDKIDKSVSSVNYPIVMHQTEGTESTYSIEANALHVWGEVDALRLSYEDNGMGEYVKEYLFQFTSGANGVTLALPSQVKWESNQIPNFVAGKVYVVSIVNNLAIYSEF